MNSLIGSTAIGLAFVGALATIVTGVLAARTRSPRYEQLARHGVYLVWAAVVVASAALLNAFVTHDFSIKLVYQYSDSRMPLVYLVSAFWGGQSGSLLLWMLVLSTASAIAITFARHRVPDLMPWVYVVLMTVGGFFLALLVFLSPPFETFYLIDPPVDGTGLNPVLQNYWMAIHPPCLLTGYSLFAVPFSFGVAAIITGRLGIDWIKVTRRWLLVSWMFLSLGCLLGGRWAYEELGWGGYWAWDPVENAAILPWFTATALIHSVMIQERRGMLKRWNFTLLVLTFWLTIFGTFLTRSGMIASVHSFAQSSIGPAFLGFVIAIAVGGIALLAARWRQMTSDSVLESKVSREGVFLLNNWILLGFMFFVLWGTIGPKLRDIVTGEDSALGAAWFNRFVVPSGLTLMLFMSVGTLIAWRKATMRNFRRNFAIPLVIALLLTPAIAAAYYFARLKSLDPQTVDRFLEAIRLGGLRSIGTLFSNSLPMLAALTALFLTVFGIAVIGLEFWRGVRSRQKKTGSGPLGGLLGLLAKHRRRYGGYLVHLGFIMVCFGIAGNAFKVEQQATLQVGDSTPLADYVLTYQGMQTEQHSDKIADFFPLLLEQCERRGIELDRSRCRTLGTIRPARFDYNDYSQTSRTDPMKVTTEIAIRTNLLEDLYVTVTGHNREGSVASFGMFVNPFVFWLWFGGVVLVGAVILCMWPAASPVRRKVRFGALRPALERMAVLAIAALPAAVIYFGAEATAQPAAQGSDTDWVEPTRFEGSEETQIYGLLRCQCGECGGKPVNQCQPGCFFSREARELVDTMVAEGRDRDDILDLFAARYGPTVLAIPNDPVFTWLIPLGAVAGGIVLLLVAARTLTRPRRSALQPAMAGSFASGQGAVTPELEARGSTPSRDSGRADRGDRAAGDREYLDRLALELDELE